MSYRVDQVGTLIQKEVSEIILRDIELPRGVFVTIHQVLVSPDLKHAKLLVTVLPADQTSATIKTLNARRKQIQITLSARIAMKFSPRLYFAEDAGEAHARTIDAVFDAIHHADDA